MRFVLFLFWSCSCFSQFNEATGYISYSSLNDSTAYPWFVSNYLNYHLDKSTLDELEPKIDNINFKLFIGFWCRDSRSFLPRFMKAREYLKKYANPDVQIIAIDKSKKSPKSIIHKYKILSVPTLIVYRDGKEIGRIEEFVVKTLEKDLVSIIIDENYQPFNAIDWFNPNK